MARQSDWSKTLTISAPGVRVSLAPSIAELWLKWTSTVPCMMWEPLYATWVIWCAQVGAVTVTLLPDTSHPIYVIRCTRPTFARLCSMVAKRGDQRNSNCGGSASLTAPCPVGSVASKAETKHPRLHTEDITSVLRCRRLRWYGIWSS